MIQEFKVRKAHPKPTHNLKPELYSIVIYLKPQIMDCRLQCWFWFFRTLSSKWQDLKPVEQTVDEIL